MVEVRPDALVIDVRRTSNRRLHAKGRTDVPRLDVSTIELFLRRSPSSPGAGPEAGAIGAGLGAVAVSPLLFYLGETDKAPGWVGLVILIAGAVGGAMVANRIANRHQSNPNDVLITVVP